MSPRQRSRETRVRPLARRSLAALFGALLVVGAACGGGGGSKGSSGPPYTLNTSVVAASSSAADSDTNDPNAPFTPNDAAVDAQEIPNPVILGGHVNVPGARPFGVPDGRTTVAGDVEDWFRAAIANGQVIRLLVAEDGASNNLDLELRRSDGSLVAQSTSSTRNEQITVPATDDYYVVVVAVSGFSNYTLTIGQAPTQVSGPSAGAPSAAEFVPGEVIVRYREGAGAAASLSPASRAQRYGMRHAAGRAGGPLLFRFGAPDERRIAMSRLGVADAPRRSIVAVDPSVAALREDTLRIVEAMRAEPDVQSADLNYVRKAVAMPADEFFPFQWHYDQINLPSAWDVVADNSGVVVAVLDTGVVTAHPDFAGQLEPGYDFITSTSRSNDGNGCDASPDDPGDLAPGGSSFHGTHVAGTVAARTSLQAAANSDGVAGVAWNATVMPLRVLGVGGGTDFDIMEALNFAAGLDNVCGVSPPRTAQIVNMSFGGPGFNQGFQDLVTRLRDDHDLIFVASAGNESSSAPSYPAAYAGVISVSAVGPTQTLAPYSNFGATIDVAAPGGDFQRDVNGDGFPDGVLSTLYDQSNDDYVYAYLQGTSMAAPHVAGVLALMLGINPNLTPVDIDNSLNLQEITEDIGSSNFFGAGLIDAVRAVNKASEGGGGGVLLPVLRVDPDGLNYGLLADTFLVSASNGGNDQQPLEVLSVSFTSDDGGSWLTSSPEAVGPTGLGSYRATIDRAGLADGLYTGTLSFDSDANDIDVPVIMQVGDAVNAMANAGHHFVLLVEPGTLATVAALEVDSSAGVYDLAFEGVDPGEYLIIAGTDSDNDFVICDPGEACGAFPTTETILSVDIQANRGVSFVTGFSTNVGAASSGGGGSTGFSRRIGERARR